MNYFFKVINIIGVLCSLWFAFLSPLWIYGAALYVAYPIGLVALLILWLSPIHFAKKLIKIILIVGFVASMAGLVLVR